MFGQIILPLIELGAASVHLMMHARITFRTEFERIDILLLDQNCRRLVTEWKDVLDVLEAIADDSKGIGIEEEISAVRSARGFQTASARSMVNVAVSNTAWYAVQQKALEDWGWASPTLRVCQLCRTGC